MKKRILLVLVSLLCYVGGIQAQFENGLYMHNGFSLPYKISFPDNYDESQKYPLIVFLHGAGEKGNDNEKQLVHVKDFLLENTKQKYPAIVIIPQCPIDNFWANITIHNIAGKGLFSFARNEELTMPMKTLIGLIEDWLTSGKVNTKQVYVGGLSMGGMGTLELLWRMPDTFAAAFPICGAGSLDKAALYSKDLHLWFFHGEKDDVVPYQNTVMIHDFLKENGYDVNYTMYKNMGHNAWDYVFKEPELFPWLFKHKK